MSAISNFWTSKPIRVMYIFGHMNYFWVIFRGLDHFGPFENFCPLCTFDHSGPFSILSHLGHFGFECFNLSLIFHQFLLADLVLLAGTNDLSSRSVSPEILISSLENSIAELKEFSNLQQIFICKIPPRFDFHNVNSKVTRYNVLLEEHFPDSDFVHVLDTVTPEFRHYHTDGLHLSQLGLRKVCSIILSKLYKVLAPDRSKYRNKSSAKKHSASKGSDSDSGPK